MSKKEKRGERGRTKLTQIESFATIGIEDMIAKGADVNATGMYGYPPLVLAIMYDELEDVKLLVTKYKANVNTTDVTGYTPLLWATIGGWATIGRKTDIAKFLIKNGANVNTKGKDGNAPLIFATKFDNPDVAKLLIGKGAHVNVKDKFGNTPLMWAAWHGRLEVVKLLVEKHADLNAKDNDGKTPLKITDEGYRYSETVVRKIFKDPDTYLKGRDYLEVMMFLHKNGAQF